MEESKKSVMQAGDYQFYGHINTVTAEVYRDLPTEAAFPEQYREDLHKYIFNDDFLNTDLPAVYTYFSAGKSGTTPLTIFGKCARKEKAVSVCRYTQAAGWAWSEGELLRDSFDSLLNFGFYSEDEVDALAAGGAVVPYGSSRDALLNAPPLDIHPSALKVLVYAAYLRWHRSAPLVRIAVPAQYTGSAYNAYVLGAVRTLYSYFPVGLRSKAGFSSYLPAGKEKGLNYLYFVFVPQAQAGPDAVYLDGSSLPVYEKMRKTVQMASLDIFIEYMLKIKSPADRAKFVADVFTDVDGGDRIKSLFPSKYAYMGDALLLLNHAGTALETMPQWLHFCDNPKEFPSSMHDELYDAIRRELTPEIFTEYLLEQYPNTMTLETFGGSFAQVVNICVLSDGLRACFWERLKGIIAANRIDPAQGLAFLRQHEKGLRKLGGAEWERLCADCKQKLGDDVVKAAFAAVDNAEGDCADLRETAALVARQASDALSAAYEAEEKAPILEKIALRGSQRIVQELKRQFQPVTRMPAENTEQIRAVIEAAEALRVEAVKEIAPEAEDFRQELAAFIDGKRSSLGAYDVLSGKVSGELAEMTDYLAAVEHISRAMSENSVFEEPDRKRFFSLIEALRPKTEEAYAQLFRNYSGGPLTMENLCSCDALVVATVLSDLTRFFTAPYAVKKAGAEEMYRDILRRQAVMDQFSAGQKLTVSVGGIELSAQVLKALLAPQNGELRQENAGVAEELVPRFIDAGVYSGRHMAPLCAMFIRCGLRFSPILDKAFAGAFRDAEEEDYLALFERVFRALKEQKRDPLEQMDQRRDRQKDALDATAKSAYKAFRKANEPRKKTGEGGSPIWKKATIALSIAAVVLTGTTAWAVISGSSAKKQNIALTGDATLYEQTIQSLKDDLQAGKDALAALEAQMAEPAGLSFLDPQYTTYTQPICQAALQKDEGIYKVYNDRYRTYNSDYVVARIGDRDVTWGQYFLWECYFVAQNAPETVTADAFLSGDVQKQVQSALVLMYADLDTPPVAQWDENGDVKAQTAAIAPANADVAMLAPEEQDLSKDAGGLTEVFAQAHKEALSRTYSLGNGEPSVG